ncbi:MAG TPA: hypothetical protein VHW23_11625 [Kofleriaceae bacterium]|nr:hypothetical protein [Kofleriaceae bacterium]
MIGWWQGVRWQYPDDNRSELGLRLRSIAAVDRRVVGATRAGLALDTPERTLYLGFRIRNVTSVARRRAGWLISDGAALVELDDQLRVRMRYQTGTSANGEKAPRSLSHG